MSLEDGEIVMTGTPKGVGVIGKNDTFTGQVYLAPEDKVADNKVLLDCNWQAQ
jgi:2-keto-4-pentenoate hydratase/2-oxohepta-3-ene-1,7-dioic acid hydratase in catechol pathway